MKQPIPALRVKCSDGFTLVEVMMSVAIMAIVFMAAFACYFLGMRMIDDARHEVLASQIVQSELEAMRTIRFDDLTSGSTYITPQTQFKQHLKDYTIRRWIFTINPQQKVVLHRISWANSREENLYRMFTTVFTDKGLGLYYRMSPQDPD
ncbi:MAG: type IV pilus modification PilV family protein [Oceanipulchritudo sp.]